MQPFLFKGAYFEYSDASVQNCRHSNKKFGLEGEMLTVKSFVDVGITKNEASRQSLASFLIAS